MPLPTVQIFLIDCGTGCTCCNSEDHQRGPFSSKEIAEKRVERYKEIRVLASQYARNGRYYVREYSAEQLPDGRLICGSSIYPGFADEHEAGSDEERINN